MGARLRAPGGRRTLAVVAMVVVLAAGAGLWWLNGARSYDELELGSTTSIGSDGRWVEVDEVDTDKVVRKTFREGRVTTFGASVRNEGGRAVEITGIGPERQPDEASVTDHELTAAGVRMNPDDRPGMSDRMVRFRPFTLVPGRERYFEIALRMPACSNYAAGSALIVGGFDVRYRTLFFDRERYIELRAPIEIVRRTRCA